MLGRQNLAVASFVGEETICLIAFLIGHGASGMGHGELGMGNWEEGTSLHLFTSSPPHLFIPSSPLPPITDKLEAD